MNNTKGKEGVGMVTMKPRGQGYPSVFRVIKRYATTLVLATGILVGVARERLRARFTYVDSNERLEQLDRFDELTVYALLACNYWMGSEGMSKDNTHCEQWGVHPLPPFLLPRRGAVPRKMCMKFKNP